MYTNISIFYQREVVRKLMLTVVVALTFILMSSLLSVNAFSQTVRATKAEIAAVKAEIATALAIKAKIEAEMANATNVSKLPSGIAFPDSLFFSREEISAIQRALLGVDTLKDDGAPKAPRVLSLSGMLYNSPDNWVIWLNGNRITPERLLPEILDITVDDSLVHLKWFDYVINDAISITLRPHQIYDIETGILLTGTGK